MRHQSLTRTITGRLPLLGNLYSLPTSAGGRSPHQKFAVNGSVEIPTSDAGEWRAAEWRSLALDYARHGETAALARMIDRGLSMNLADDRGNTLLMLACYQQNGDTARMLLCYGAAVDRRNRRGQTPLGAAACKGHADMVTLLLAQGAEVDADNGLGLTPLMLAALFGHSRVVEQLIAHGASLQRRNRLGLSAGFVLWLARGLARLWRRSAPFRPTVSPTV